MPAPERADGDLQALDAVAGALRPEQRVSRDNLHMVRKAAQHDPRRDRLDRSDVKHKRPRTEVRADCPDRFFQPADRHCEDDDPATRRE